MVYEVRMHSENDVNTDPNRDHVSVVPGHNGGVGTGRNNITQVNVSGGPLKDDSIVAMGNTEMTAVQAYQHGFIQKDAAGNYINPDSLAAQVAAEEGGDDDPDSDPESGSNNDAPDIDETLLADPETEVRLEEMTQAAGSGAIMEANVLKALDGAESDKAMSEVGEKLGIGSDPEAVRESASQTYDGLYTAAVTHVESHMPDVNAAEAFEWAGANMDRADIIDVQLKWYTGDPSGLMNMVKAYQKRDNSLN